jgi:hypothetical protein
MTKKKENHFTKIIIKIMMFVLSIFKIIPQLILLIEYEAEDAVKNLLYILTLSLLAGLLMLCVWLGLQSMLIVYLISLKFTLLGSLSMVVLINMIFLVIILHSISRIKTQLSFKRTRRMLDDLRKS